MALIGYARVSTEDQSLDAQRQALMAAGCTTIFEEKASGGSRARPQLARAFYQIKSGDTLVVVKIDRLARSLSHLLEIIERLTNEGAKLQIPVRPDRHHRPDLGGWSCRCSAPWPSSSGR